MRLGAAETGGTKIVLALTDENGSIFDRYSIPTKDPETTIKEMISWFRNKEIEALGIGSFGPLDLDTQSRTYGYITATPKQGWKFTDITGPFIRSLNVPVSLDTDVNAAMLGEVKYGNAMGCMHAVYITIGTGIGAGVWLNGRLHHGMIHPEAGHIPVARSETEIPGFKCICPYHTSCFEGMASGPSILKRWGQEGSKLYDRQEVWELEAYYVAQGICSYIMTYSPEKIVVGGGVMHTPGLIELVRKEVLRQLGGYIQSDTVNDIERYVVLPGLKDNAGIIGASVLAAEAFRKSQ